MKRLVYGLIYKFMRINYHCGNLVMDILGQKKHNEIIDYMKTRA